MSFCYQEILSFYNDVEKLCHPNKYNLVLHKHLGDVFYAIGLKDEFERVYGKKLHFIVRPQHEFLMKMYGITDYAVFDLDKIVKKNINFQKKYFGEQGRDKLELDCLENNTFQALFHCIPILGKPFVCENLFYFFLNYPYFWCQRWLKNLGINDRYKFSLPQNKLSIQPELHKKLKKVAPLNKIVLFAPEAATATELAPEFWNIIADKVYEKGYTIIVNSKKYKINHGICAFDLDLSLEEVVTIGLNCAYVFSLRSGLCDVLVGAKEKLYAVYPAMLRREFGSLQKPFKEPTNIHEICLYNWETTKFIWEDVDFTKDIQKYVNSLYRNYITEKIKAFFSFSKNKGGHIFWRELFKNLAGKSFIFPDNNIDNPKPKHKIMKFLGIKLFEKQYKLTENLQKYKTISFLHGLIYYVQKPDRTWRVHLLGLSILNKKFGKKEVIRFLGIPIWQKSIKKVYLRYISKKTKGYDDVYIFRHHIGETFVYLSYIKYWIKQNASKHPLILVWSKKYLPLYRMFVPKNIEVQYIPLAQRKINLFEESVIQYKQQRIFIPTFEIAENIKARIDRGDKANFYTYILENMNLPPNAKVKPLQPQISDTTKKDVKKVLQQNGINKKFILICPEATTLVQVPMDFWQNLIDKLTKLNYQVVVNSHQGQDTLVNAVHLNLSLDKVYALALQASGIITMASGLSVLLTSTHKKIDALYTEFSNSSLKYTAEMAQKAYSLHHLPGVSHPNITEFIVTKNNLSRISEEILKKI